MSYPAGWYPQRDGRQRYWDGWEWTTAWAPGALEAPLPDVGQMPDTRKSGDGTSAVDGLLRWRSEGPARRS
jgi:hypothetical protein